MRNALASIKRDKKDKLKSINLSSALKALLWLNKLIIHAFIIRDSLDINI